MKKLAALAVFLLSSGIAGAQAPAPFDMNRERTQQHLPPLTSQPRPAAPPVLTPAPAPVPSLTVAPKPAVQPATPSSPLPVAPPPVQQGMPAAQRPQQVDTAGRRYLVPESKMRLNGEIDQRAWSVYLTPEQAAAPAVLHIGYQNSIVIAPEVSSLVVTINDVPIYSNPVNATDQISQRVADIPAGTLKAGANMIRFRADQRHRTDCTIESTFELWTDIDPASTYLSFGSTGPAAAALGRFSRLDDIRAIGVDEDGNTHIRFIAPALDQLGATGVLMRLSQSLSLMGGMPNQSFVFEKAPSALPQPGELAVFVGTQDELRPIMPNLPASAATSAIASFLDYPGSNGTSALVLSGPNWPSLEGLIDSLVAATDGSATIRRETLATQAWHGVDTPFLSSNAMIDFSQLGIDSQEFAGRLFRTNFTIGVPSDFYANAYGEARILLDAAYTGDVLPGSHIDIFVNDSIASTVPITSSGGAILQHLPIKLTLQHFKPGVNNIVIEAALKTQQDVACVPGSTADKKPRFAIFGSSQFEMPDFARIAQVPNLAAMSGTGFPYRASNGPVALFLGRVDESTLSAAATFLGKIAMAGHRIVPVDATISAARLSGANALFVGSIAEFPVNVLNQLGIDQDSRNSWNPAGAPTSANTGSQLTLQDWQQRSGSSFFSRQFASLSDWAKSNFDLTLGMLRFAPSTDQLYKPPQAARTIVAQANDPTQTGTWTAIIAPDQDSLAEGMESFATRDNWRDLKGRIVTFESDDKEPEFVPVSWFRFLPTQPFSLSNARLIAANWLSDNIMSYALLLAAGGILLGLATGGLLSLLGRNK